MEQEGFSFMQKPENEPPVPEERKSETGNHEKKEMQYFLVSFSKENGDFVPAVAYEAIDEKDLRTKIKNSTSGLIITKVESIDRYTFKQMNRSGNYYN